MFGPWQHFTVMYQFWVYELKCWSLLLIILSINLFEFHRSFLLLFTMELKIALAICMYHPKHIFAMPQKPQKQNSIRISYLCITFHRYFNHNNKTWALLVPYFYRVVHLITEAITIVTHTCISRQKWYIQRRECVMSYKTRLNLQLRLVIATFFVVVSVHIILHDNQEHDG